jgi:hypothetical protein
VTTKPCSSTHGICIQVMGLAMVSANPF